jgi:polar amino acid transport system substrate-binding protein
VIARLPVGGMLGIVLLGLLALGGCSRDGTPPVSPDDPNRPLIWAADDEGGEPYVAPDPKESGKVIGFEKEIVDALAKELGRPIQWRRYSFNSLVPALLRRKDFDFAMNGLEITPDRKAKLRFSRPYYVYRQQLVARADEQRFASYEELKKVKGATVGTLEDTAAQRMLKRDGIQTEIYEDSVGPYRDLQSKRRDAVLQDWPIAVYLVKKRDDFKDSLKFVGEPIEPGLYGIAFRPEDEALAKQVDAALERIIKNGELRKILEKWELWNDDQKYLEKGSEEEILKALKLKP